MKFIKSEISNCKGSPKRYIFGYNLDEINILLSLLTKSEKLIPECESSEMLIDRIRNMIKSFEFAFYADDKFGKNFKCKEEDE